MYNDREKKNPGRYIVSCVLPELITCLKIEPRASYFPRKLDALLLRQQAVSCNLYRMGIGYCTMMEKKTPD